MNTQSTDNEHTKGFTLQIIELINQLMEDVFIDQVGFEYIVFTTADGQKASFRIGSNDFLKFLQGLVFKKFKKTIRPDQKREIQEILSVQISEKAGHNRRKIFRRVGYCDGKIYYDLGGRTIQIDKNNWSEVRLERELFWFNQQLSLPQVVPTLGGNLDDLFKLINVSSDQDKLLLKLFVVTSMVPDIPKPILVIHGPKGSGKTGMLRLLLNIIDPTEIIDVPVAKQDEFHIFASNRWAIGIDNVSRIGQKLSDDLCKLSTGGSFVRRVLYTTNDLTASTTQNVVILNGIPNVAERPDLLDRSLLIELAPFELQARKTERQIKDLTSKYLSGILGSIFSILAKALACVEDVQIGELQRMADFHRWSLAVGQVMGYTSEQVNEALRYNQQKQIEAAKEASWVSELLISYLTERFVYEGTATELLTELRKFNDENGLPYSFQLNRMKANSITNEIRRVDEVLRAYGVCFTPLVRGKDRRFQISMDEKTRDERLGQSEKHNSVSSTHVSFDDFDSYRVSNFTDWSNE